MDFEKKLKRGLSDVSSLFEKKRAASEHAFSSHEALKPQFRGSPCFGVFYPSHPELSSKLMRWLAMKLTAVDMPILEIRILSTTDHLKPETAEAISERPSRADRDQVRSLVLTWNQWEEFKTQKKNELLKLNLELEDQIILLDVDWHDPRAMELQEICDLLLLVGNSDQDNLEQCYRQIKRGSQSGSRPEFGFLFHGDRQSDGGRWLYEHFSEMVRKHLKFSFCWLGYLEFLSENEWPYFQFSAMQLIQNFIYDEAREKRKQIRLTHLEACHDWVDLEAKKGV